MYLHHPQKMIFFYNQADTCIHILNLVINTCTFGWTVKNWQKKNNQKLYKNSKKNIKIIKKTPKHNKL